MPGGDAAAARAAAQVAAAVISAAEVAEEVTGTADAVQAVAAAAAQQLANDAIERGAALALVGDDATLAAKRLEQTNERLLQAGRDDHAIALALQAAMLTGLPRLDGVELAARYRTAAKQAQVGGEW